MGSRHSKQRRQSEDVVSTSSGMDSEGREAAPPELLSFLETASGARWLAGILLGGYQLWAMMSLQKHAPDSCLQVISVASGNLGYSTGTRRAMCTNPVLQLACRMTRQPLLLLSAPADLPEHMHNLRMTTLAEVNHFVIKKYKGFVSSDIGACVCWLSLQQ